MRPGEPLTPEDLAAIQSLLRGDVISMPPDIAAQFLDPQLFTTALREGVAPGTLPADVLAQASLEPELFTTALREGVAPGTLPADVLAQASLEPELFTTALREGVAPGTLTTPAAEAGPLTPTAAEAGGQTISPALLSSLVAFPAAIGASDPYIQRTLAAAYGQPAATALNLVGALAAPFTFGASAFLPIIGAAFASMFGSPGRYWKHRKLAAQQLQAWAPVLVEALPLARSREEVEWLANLINPRVRGFRLTPEGLDIAYREVAERAQPLQEYVQRVLQALPSVWESPEVAQAYFEGRPTVAQAVARQVLSELERGGWRSRLIETIFGPYVLGPEEARARMTELFGAPYGEEVFAVLQRGRTAEDGMGGWYGF
jgi:hypothetical protein